MNNGGNNCRVLSTTDDSHVTRVTPLDTKRKELAEALALTESQERAQLKQNDSMRQPDQARPLGGIGSKG